MSFFCHGYDREVPGEHTCHSQPGVTSTAGIGLKQEPVPGVVGHLQQPRNPEIRSCAVNLPIAPPSRMPPSPSQTRFAGRSPSRHAFKANRVPSTLTARHRIGHPSPHPARAWWHHPDGMKSGSGRGPLRALGGTSVRGMREWRRSRIRRAAHDLPPGWVERPGFQRHGVARRASPPR